MRIIITHVNFCNWQVATRDLPQGDQYTNTDRTHRRFTDTIIFNSGEALVVL